MDIRSRQRLTQICAPTGRVLGGSAPMIRPRPFTIRQIVAPVGPGRGLTPAVPLASPAGRE